MTKQQVKQFLLRNDYALSVSYIDGKECRVKIPQNRIIGMEKGTEVVYHLSPKYFTWTCGPDAKPEQVVCPLYASRICIYSLIISVAVEMEYNHTMICMLDNEGKLVDETEPLLAFLDEPELEEEKEKERKFAQVTKVLNEEKARALAVKYGLLEGYDILQRILKS